MIELRQSTEMKVRVGPFVDVSDGFTPQTDITLGGDTAEVLKHNWAATVDISAATWAAVTGATGWYDLTLTASYTDTLGQLSVIVQDNSDCLPVHRDFMVTTANYWDSKYSTDYREVDVTQVSADTAAADALELFIEALGTDDKVLVSTDAQDLSATLDVNTKTITNGIIVAATLGADAITEAKIADDAIAAEHLATGALTADAFAANALVAATFAADSLAAATFATGCLTADAFAANALVAATFATDSIAADALAADAVTEIWAKAMTDMAAGAPSATASVLTAINYLYEAWRNKTETTASEIAVYKDDASTKLTESDISDDGTTFTKGEFGAVD